MLFLLILATGAGAQTGYTEDFNGGTVPAGWQETGNYKLSSSGGMLLIDIDKRTNQHANYFPFELDTTYNFFSASYLSMDLRVSQSVVLTILFYDDQDVMVSKRQRIIESGQLTPIFVDFSGSGSVDYTKIKRLRFNFGRYAFSYAGQAVIDNLKLGTDATPFSTILAIPDQYFYQGTKDAALPLFDIYNADSITISGAASLIGNIHPSAVSSGNATILFDCLEGNSGTDTIIVSSKGSPGFADGTQKARIVVEDNKPPSMDSLPDMEVAVSDMEMKINFTGLKDNNISVEQAISVGAISLQDSLLFVQQLNHETDLTYGELSLDLLKPGEASIVISLTEEDTLNGVMKDTFRVKIYEELNEKPTVDDPGILARFIGNPTDTLYLTGITDGDDGSQLLALAFSSNDSSVILPVSATLAGGDSAMLVVRALSLGSASLSLRITDDGGNAINNGNQFTVSIFTMNIVDLPQTGYVADFSDVAGDKARGLWASGTMYQCTTVDSSQNGFYAMRVETTDKSYWDGLNLKFQTEGIELDLSAHPYFSMEVYPLDDNTLHWIWFYDYSETRNDQNNREKRVWAKAGEWNKVSFDFSGKLDWMNEDLGTDIDKSRIIRILFDMHNAEFVWPPPANYTGSFLIRNLRVGSEAEVPNPPITPVMDKFAIPLFFERSGEHHIELTGIHDGTGSTDGLSIQVSSSDESVISIISVDNIGPDGSSGFTLEAMDDSRSLVTITLSGGNSATPFVTEQWASVQSGDYSGAAHAIIDNTKKQQEIRGFGCFQDNVSADLYINEMNASAVRLGLISNQIEWENDNNDPYTLNMEAFDYAAFDWDYFRRLKEGGVESFILTSWSPPGWMKDNLTESYFTAGQSSYTDMVYNRLSYHYYEEFAEEMVAVIRMFEEKAGITLTGIGLQNEPAFHEPYPSAILDPKHFNELIRVVGKRFEQEGITTKLYMPEQVFSQTANSISQYIEELQADSDANSYCEVIATHGYAADGIAVSAPNFSQWTEMWNNAQEGDYPKELWMTETWLAYSSFNDAIYISAAIQGAMIWGNVNLWTQWNFQDQFTTNGQPNSMLFAMRNFARYIRPGSVRLFSSCSDVAVLVSAFENTDSNTVTMVIVNTDTKNVSLDISAANLPHNYEIYRTSAREDCKYLGIADISSLMAIPARSITTLYATRTDSLTMDMIEDVQLEINAGEQDIAISGISDGSGQTAGLLISAETDDSTLISKLAISAINPDGTALLVFTPGNDLTGFAKITVTLTDGNRQRIETIYVEVGSTVSVRELMDERLKIFPNPAGDLISVEYTQKFDQLSVFDFSGRAVKLVSTGTVSSTSLDLRDLPDGMYILRLSHQGHALASRPFMKQ